MKILEFASIIWFGSFIAGFLRFLTGLRGRVFIVKEMGDPRPPQTTPFL